MNLGYIEKSGKLRIKPWAAGWEAQTLPLCYADPPKRPCLLASLPSFSIALVRYYREIRTPSLILIWLSSPDKQISSSAHVFDFSVLVLVSSSIKHERSSNQRWIEQFEAHPSKAKREDWRFSSLPELLLFIHWIKTRKAMNEKFWQINLIDVSLNNPIGLWTMPNFILFLLR